MFSVPQENRLLKLPLELMRELTSNGLSEFRWITRLLVE